MGCSQWYFGVPLQSIQILRDEVSQPVDEETLPSLIKRHAASIEGSKPFLFVLTRL